MIQENGALVEFYRDAVQNNFKSAQEGRPIFDDFDFVRIMTPGDTRTTVVRKVTDQDKQRFQRAWDMYQRGLDQVLEGTPLDKWPGVTTSQVKELQYVNIRTVEQLVSVSDSGIQKLGPGYMQLRTRAKQFLEAAADEAAATAHARENEQLREQMALMQEQMDAMQEQLQKQQQEKEQASKAGDDAGADGQATDSKPAARTRANTAKPE